MQYAHVQNWSVARAENIKIEPIGPTLFIFVVESDDKFKIVNDRTLMNKEICR